MTKHKQIIKNLELSEKLANYIAEHPELLIEFSSNASFIVFSADDKELNKQNKKLIKVIQGEGKQVVKAEEIENTQWKFTAVPS